MKGYICVEAADLRQYGRLLPDLEGVLELFRISSCTEQKRMRGHNRYE